MAWLYLGIITPIETTWQETSQSAVNQNLIRLTYISSKLIELIKSRLLIKRLWQVEGELLTEEKAIVIYPSPNRVLLPLPVIANLVEPSGYKIQVKKYYPFCKSIITEPAYSLKVEVG